MVLGELSEHLNEGSAPFVTSREQISCFSVTFQAEAEEVKGQQETLCSNSTINSSFIIMHVQLLLK